MAEAKYVSEVGKSARIDSGPIAYRYLQLDKEYPVVMSQNLVWGEMDALNSLYSASGTRRSPPMATV